MNNDDFDTAPNPSLISLMYIIYGLHFVSALNGILTPAFILTAFLTGWPSIIAVVLSYLKRNEANGTYLESHFRWVIRTFWIAVVWLIVAGILTLTFIGIPLAIIAVCIVGVWVLYRIVRGVLALLDDKTMPID